MPEKRMKFAQWDVVIAELESQVAELNTAIKAIKRVRDTGVGFGRLVEEPIALGPSDHKPEASGTTTPESRDIRSDAFFQMTIAEAAVKYLRKWANRTPQSTKAIIDALDRGGIKGKGYQSVYKLLQRRAKDKGDVVNVHGDWGLSEWYLNSEGGDVFKGTGVADKG